ncbi:MAG: D-isomer specific 2-hydroxyacid dehydrogenase family protein [Lacisediminihabitans sp.]
MQASPQHQPVSARPAEALAAERRPTPGSIAVLPDPRDVFVDAVRAGGGEVAELSSDTRGVVWLSSERSTELAELLEQNPQVGWVQLPWAGVDAFAPVLASYAGTSRPLWTSAKGAYSQPVAEHALALTLALLRVLPKRVLATSWSTVSEGTSLFGLNVLIVGAGGIALELMRLLQPFKVRVTIVRRSTEQVPGAIRTLAADQLLKALPEADVVVIAAALTEGTSKLIGAGELAAMKPAAVLVNIARGGLVDTDALTAALATGSIAGAGVDVTDPEPLPDGHPLWNEPRVIITPHSADTPDMTAPLLAERISTNVEAFLGHGRFVGVVDPAAGY